ncbi:hypothetical protein [Pseudonocardia sp. DLS-67]
MQRRSRGVGALEVFVAGTAGPGDDDVALGQALADMAATGILDERSSRSSGALINQLQTALDSRGPWPSRSAPPGGSGSR